MQVILKSKKEIKFATEIEDILNGFCPGFKIQIRISPIKRKTENIVKKDNKIIIGTTEIKDTPKTKENIKIVKEDPKIEKKKIRKIYNITTIDYVEDKIYKEDKYEEEMSKLLDKFKEIKSYQY